MVSDQKYYHHGSRSTDNISLAFFFDPGCSCYYRVRPQLEQFKLDYPHVNQIWYNISDAEIDNITLFIDFNEAYNVPPDNRSDTPFLFIGDHYLNFEAIDYQNVSALIETYRGVDVPLWPAWELTWTMHIAYFYDPDVVASSASGEYMDSVIAFWNQDEKHLILNNYSLDNLTNDLLLEAYFSEFNLSKETTFASYDELYAAVFISDDFLLNQDITYESLNTTVTNHSGHNTPLHDITIDVTGGNINILIFYDPTCGECAKARKTLRDMKVKYPNLYVHEYPTDDPDTEILKHTYFDHYDVPIKDRGTLGVFIGDKYYMDADSLHDGIEDQIKRYSDGVESPDLEPDKNVVKDTFNTFTVLAVMGAGLIDSINPCAIAVLIFFIGYLHTTGRTRKQILTIGLAYTIGIFITYLALGLGLYYFIASSNQLLSISKWLYPVIAILTIIFGLYSLYDYKKARSGKKEEMKLQLPGPVKKLIGRVIKHQVKFMYFAIFALITGITISLLEFLCTGQVYLPTIVVVYSSVPELQATAVLYLVLYNLMFIMPLIIIFALVYFGLGVERVQHFLDNNRAVIKLATAVLFFCLAIWLILYSLTVV
jgi:cytochrome c biogenesis protein CcdA